MLALDSVEGPERLWACFAESPEGTGCGYRNLPIKIYADSRTVLAMVELQAQNVKKCFSCQRIMSDGHHELSPIQRVTDSVAALVVDGATSLPSPVRKNLFMALDRLCTAAIDIPVAYLEGKAAERRAETQARVGILAANAEQIAGSIQVDSEYARLASEKYSRRIVREQINLDKVCRIAASQISSEYSNEQETTNDAGTSDQISDDWLDSFRKEACGKSTEEMQLLFGRILAGEIRKPDSFSIRTVKLMGQLDIKAAGLFRRLCSMSTALTVNSSQIDCRVISYNNNPAQTGLSVWGLSYGDLTILEEYGLIISDYNSWMDYRYVISRDGKVSALLDYCNRALALVPSNQDDWPHEKELRISGVGLSNAGKELRQIVQVEESTAYTQGLEKYFQDQGFVLSIVKL